jgi:hypothetical protein
VPYADIGIGHNVAVVGERHLTDRALPVLFDNFAVEQLPHLRLRAEFAIPSGVMRIFDPLHAKRSDAAFLLDRLAAATIEGTMDGAEFLRRSFMNFLLQVSFRVDPGRWLLCWSDATP